jgi:hypothetical protein
LHTLRDEESCSKALSEVDEGVIKMAKSYETRTGHQEGSIPERAQSDRAEGFGDRGGGGMYPHRGDGRDREIPDGWEEPGTVQRVVTRYPYTVVLTSFSFGFGFGLFVTLLLTRREPTWLEPYAPEPIGHLPDRLKRVPEVLASYVPSSWKRG